MLSTAVNSVKQSEEAAIYDRNEAVMASQVSELLPLPPSLDGTVRELLIPFIDFCHAACVRHAPAKPSTVAAFILKARQSGVDRGRLLGQIRAIETLHDHYGLANPVATLPARAALERLGTIEAPRSWKQSEKLMFAQLPPEIKAIIGRRDNEREREIRRAMQAAADAIRLASGADKPAKTNEAKNELPQA